MRSTIIKFRPVAWTLVFVAVFAVSARAQDAAFHYQSEDDFDDDSIVDTDDVCPLVSDLKQWDVDDDGVGDACDNCAGFTNPSQSDIDGDSLGDVCDPDRDADGIYDSEDLCPDVYDEDQADLDSDSAGDACDDDIDGDGELNLAEACPFDIPPIASGPTCNNDSDNDGVDDFDLGGTVAVWLDNCPFFPNDDQADLDSDSVGDPCDMDIDGDGLDDSRDNCPLDANDDQADGDRDGLGDVCDGDFCFIVLGDEENCLDPADEFFAYTPTLTSADTGDQILLRLFANREDTEIDYTWRIVGAPETTELSNAVGTVTESTPFEYRYTDGLEATFMPLVAGSYTVEVTAMEVASSASSTARATFVVEGSDLSESGGCSCSSVGMESTSWPASLWAGVLLLLGVILIRRQQL